MCEFGAVEAEEPQIAAAADCALATVSPAAEARCLDGARVKPTRWEWFAAADTGTAAFTKVTTATCDGKPRVAEGVLQLSVALEMSHVGRSDQNLSALRRKYVGRP